ncbi:MAG: type II toxin-antitoxin system Phd/YefM family antitoxin [Planctomycetes bacterium]|nr:type II toxin-antitoxin system Phd/YefM family antitoxin [Planctomycetota bacterium]
MTMAKKLDVTQLPPDVAALLTAGEQPLVIERDGRPVAVIVSPEAYQRWQERGRRLFAVLDHIGERNLDRAESDVESTVQQAIDDVRAKRT